MAATAQSQAERTEVETVLRSGIFHRAPNLASFFRYICDRYFEGEADRVKEYSIAVEALGRSAEFDQKKDSIVRVEAHRLRKRLSDYYESDGAEHAIHICIPPGQYVPRFVVREPKSSAAEPMTAASETTIRQAEPPALESEVIKPAAVAVTLEHAPPVTVVEVPARTPRPARFIWVTFAVLCLAAGSYLVWFQSHKRTVPPAEVWQGSTEPIEGELRFLAGYHGPAFHDRQGRIWQADRYYNGGVSSEVRPGRAYEALPDPAFVHSQRAGNFRYDIPVTPGVYELRLYFIETEFGEGNPGGGPVNVRLFRVHLNHTNVLDLFDAQSEAGAPNRLHVRVFRDVSPAADGKLHLEFQPVADAAAFLSALELLPTKPGRARPIRIVAQRNNVTDTEGAVWLADQYAVGGTQVDRTSFANEPQRMLFRGERYGNFAYHIPVAAGKYRVRLYFAETYFGTKLPFAINNNGSPRIFNVFANGVTLLRNFDLAKEAGGPNRPLVREFPNLEPNAQGMIVLEFIPVHNYAEVNAIEVLQME